VKHLLLALALLAPPGVHYQGVVGTGAVQWTPPGISLDVAPTTNSGTNPSANTVTFTLGSGQAGKLYVISVVAVGNTAAAGPVSVTGGLTWTQLGSQQGFTGVVVNLSNASAWYAYDASGTLNGTTITITRTNTSDAWVWAYSAYRFSGANSTQNGNTAGSESVASAAATISLTPTYSGSYLIWGAQGSAGPAYSAASSNTADVSSVVTYSPGDAALAIGHYNALSTASSAVTLGASDSKAYRLIFAAEIRGQ
jgi:hypothetical protein